MAHYTTQQVKVAEALSSVETARMVLEAVAEKAMAILQQGRLPTDEERTGFRCHSAFAGKLAMNAVQIVWDAGGGAVIYDTTRSPAASETSRPPLGTPPRPGI